MAAEPSATQVDPRRWWALGVLSLVLIVTGMDNLILNVALPTLVRQLHASPAQLCPQPGARAPDAATTSVSLVVAGSGPGRT